MLVQCKGVARRVVKNIARQLFTALFRRGVCVSHRRQKRTFFYLLIIFFLIFRHWSVTKLIATNLTISLNPIMLRFFALHENQMKCVELRSLEKPTIWKDTQNLT